MIKKMMNLLKNWFGGKCMPTAANEARKTLVKKETVPRKSSLLVDLETYLFDNYDFRFNVLTEQTEFREKNETEFHMVDQRVLNTFCMKAKGFFQPMRFQHRTSTPSMYWS